MGTCQQIAKLTKTLKKGRVAHQNGLRLFIKVNLMFLFLVLSL